LWPDSFGQWAQQLQQEGAVRAAARQTAGNYRASSGVANDLAEEAEQHCLAQAARHLGTPGYFTSYEHFRNWVRRCAINYIHDHFRRRRRERRAQQDPDTVPTAQPGMDEETAAQVRECWDNLSARERALLRRYYLEGRTLDEMAEEFLPPDNRSANACRLAIRREIQDARARLEQCLLAHGVVLPGFG
jgi:RNA polymerase sigma factor (sigma-70 family)